MLTPDVRLRPLEPRDATVMAGWALDKRFCMAADWSFGNPPAAYVAFHEGIIREPPPELIRLGVAGDGELVGYVDLHGSEPHRRELGFVIGDSRRWGHGLGRAAACAGLAYGFNTLGLTEIWAEALAANVASVRILQDLEMTETGSGDAGTYLGQPTHYRRFTVRFW